MGVQFNLCFLMYPTTTSRTCGNGVGFAASEAKKAERALCLAHLDLTVNGLMDPAGSGLRGARGSARRTEKPSQG
jgi:hypothetical protein